MAEQERQFVIRAQPPTVDAFLARIRLSWLDCEMEDGSAQAFFDDDLMFGGHSIVVDIEPDGTVSKIDLFG